MNKLIYYPGFEAKSEDWLKFALLYIGELDPIIPWSGDSILSDRFKAVSQETNLINIYRPEYRDGEVATITAISEAEKILERPQLYTRIFRHGDFVSAWKNPEVHDYTLFHDKYTSAWEDFCLTNDLATKSDYGIRIPTDLGYVYMTILSQMIANKYGISPITDHRNFDRFSVFSQKSDNVNEKKLKIAQGVIELKLPANISAIPLREVIRFRNRDGFKERLYSLHVEMDKFWKNIENGSTEKDFVDSFKGIWRDFTEDVVKLGLDSISFGLGSWILLNAPQITTPEYVNGIVIAGISLVVGATFDIKNTLEKTKTKRYTRKYLTDLTKLQPD